MPTRRVTCLLQSATQKMETKGSCRSYSVTGIAKEPKHVLRGVFEVIQDASERTVHRGITVIIGKSHCVGPLECRTLPASSSLMTELPSLVAANRFLTKRNLESRGDYVLQLDLNGAALDKTVAPMGMYFGQCVLKTGSEVAPIATHRTQLVLAESGTPYWAQGFRTKVAVPSALLFELSAVRSIGSARDESTVGAGTVVALPSLADTADWIVLEVPLRSTVPPSNADKTSTMLTKKSERIGTIQIRYRYVSAKCLAKESNEKEQKYRTKLTSTSSSKKGTRSMRRLTLTVDRVEAPLVFASITDKRSRPIDCSSLWYKHSARCASHASPV